MIHPPKMVLFDCDGVVVDSETLTNQVVRDDLAERGLDLSLQQVMHRFVGGTMADVAQKATDHGANIPPNWTDVVYPKIYAVLAESIEAIPDIEMVLDRLDAANILYAIGSNGRLEKMQITLGRTGLISRFEGRLYSAQDLAKAKPAPDVYLKAAMDAGIAPADCVVIEDSVSGAKAGKAAGMRTLGFIAETPRANLAPVCDDLFSSMRDLPKLLGL
jgi:HAD superfamily hydrolase (TIGR01509 family)